MAGVLNPTVAYAAGALTILSPCVLPLVPIVLGSAAQRHRLGPVALAFGLVVSFTVTGFVLATLGDRLGLDGEQFRRVGAILLLVIGAILVLSRLQALLAQAAGPIANWGGQRQADIERFGLAGQAGIGVLLGLVWSPCVGPTLGAATLLAAQGKDLGSAALVMAAFGCGIASVLLVVGFAARGLLKRWRGRLMSAGEGGRKALGMLVIAVGLLIITGGDRLLEGWAVAASPDWLLHFTTLI
jgi:cytochrome c biogenesis protein CcdA